MDVPSVTVKENACEVEPLATVFVTDRLPVLFTVVLVIVTLLIPLVGSSAVLYV